MIAFRSNYNDIVYRAADATIDGELNNYPEGSVYSWGGNFYKRQNDLSFATYGILAPPRCPTSSVIYPWGYSSIGIYNC